MYKLWATQGQGGSVDATFDTLEEAIAAAERMKGEASFAIELPDGTFYEWKDDELQTMPPQERD